MVTGQRPNIGRLAKFLILNWVINKIHKIVANEEYLIINNISTLFYEPDFDTEPYPDKFITNIDKSNSIHKLSAFDKDSISH